jgi:sec-independent protein translocase protein TatA
MGTFSIWHWLIVLVVVLLLFGRGKIPELMGDLAKGIKSFKRGMNDDEELLPPTSRRRARPPDARAFDGIATGNAESCLISVGPRCS